MPGFEPISSSSFADAIKAALHEVFVETERISIRGFEDEPKHELVERLLPMVLRQLDRACELMSRILAHYDPNVESTFFEEATNDQVPAVAVDTASSPSVVIGDLAFMAITELRQHRHRIQGHRTSDAPQELMSDCGSALRAIKKSLYAVEPLLCELEQIPRQLPPRLNMSLQVRRHYRKLWSFATAAGTVTPTTVRAALRVAGTRIAMLVGSDVYPLLRENDRFHIRDLQVRILDWLGAGDEPAAAMRIWQDFALFVEILRQVNLREELVEHDRAALRLAIDALQTRGSQALPEVCRALEAVLGVDDALDRLLRTAPSAQELLRELLRVATQFPSDFESGQVATPIAL